MPRKMSKDALAKLKEKGINVRVIKQPRPMVMEELNAAPVVMSAVPEVQEQNTPKKPAKSITRKWVVANVERNFDGYITGLTITELP